MSTKHRYRGKEEPCADALHPRCLWSTCPRHMSSAQTVPNRAKQGKWIRISAKAGVWQFHLCPLSHAQIKSLISGRIKKDLSATGRLELSRELDSNNTHLLSPGDAGRGFGWQGFRHLRLLVTAQPVDDNCFWINVYLGIPYFHFLLSSWYVIIRHENSNQYTCVFALFLLSANVAVFLVLIFLYTLIFGCPWSMDSLPFHLSCRFFAFVFCLCIV